MPGFMPGIHVFFVISLKKPSRGLMRKAVNLLKRFNAIWPVQSSARKFRFAADPNRQFIAHRPVPLEGRFAIYNDFDKQPIIRTTAGLTFAEPEAISTSPGTSGLLAFASGGEMTGSTRSSDGLDDRRKRLLFRCWHRGTREMDLILGRFADAEIANLSESELAQFEYLMDVPDPDLYAALTGNMPPAPEFANGLFDRIKSFRGDRDA